jgi:hypothetical protein
MGRGPIRKPPTSLEESDPIENLRGRVLKPIKERFYRPLNQLISRLGYLHCVVLLSAVTALGAAFLRVWEHPEEAKDALTVARFYIDARKLVPPRDANVADSIVELTNELKDASSPANRDMQNGNFGPWTEAQLVISLQGSDTINREEMALWFQDRSGKCSCWHMWGPEDHTPDHIGATAWVLLALAQMGVRPRPDEIDFILGNQHVAGWWSMYPASDDPMNASTYATSFAIWSLEELLRRDLTDKSQEDRVKSAIYKGREWLEDNTVPGKKGLWKDYPHSEYGEESISVSGLALHALHRTPGPPPTANDAYWMANLPSDLPLPKDDTSSSPTVITKQFGASADSTHHLKLPWVLIGTVDAYPAGNIVQRARAARLLHQVSDRRESIRGELHGMPWLQAETLIALRYVRGDDVI